jgi:signal transduction histidine kinase
MNELTVFDHIFDTAVGVNQKGEIVYFNNQASIFFKLPPRLLKQKSQLMQICESSEIDFEEWVHKALLSFEILISPEIRLHLPHNPETEYSVIVKLIPIESKSGALFIILFQDKTLERNLHQKYREQVEELKRTHNQILQADKLTTLGELTANISHEINNPLTIAAGHTEIMRDYLNSPTAASKIDKLKNANQTVFESLERVNQIIRNMKDFLHQNEDEKEYCDLGVVLDAATEWVAPSAKNADISITKRIDGQKIAVLANRIKLEQVIINLVKNSIDALKDNNQENGEIKISVSKSDSEQQTIIDIIDNGPGLPEEIKKNLFKPFMTTKDAGKGTGLGLSICAKIIETHRGKLEYIESENGCHFRIKLPLIEIYSYTRNDKSLSGSLKQKRILVLDNEVQILNVLNAFVQDEGLVFIGSSDPADALDFLTKAQIDLIITDFSMPNMNGSEFSAKAREYGYDGPILYMTSAKFIEQYNKDKKDLEISGLIIKPFNKDDVMKTVHSALKASGGKA